MNLTGTYTALVTPFRAGKFDERALKDLLNLQVAGGVEGVIPVGTTGESATLNMDEHLRVIEKTVEFIGGRCPVFAGTGSNNTEEAVYLTNEAAARGVDGFLIVSPYYNKPSQAGILAHYGRLCKCSSKPIIVYSVPSRTGGEVAVETMRTLSERHPQIVSIKEAGGSIERFSQLRQVLPERVSILCGDDSMTLPALAVGAKGVISVASNLIPAEVSKLVRTFLSGDSIGAEAIHRRFYPLFRDLFIETNPVPVKAALARRGWMTAEVRMPLVELMPASQEKLFSLLASYGL
jgi:4-hydroxy-tetrahydrodipicolinate synthase